MYNTSNIAFDRHDAAAAVNADSRFGESVLVTPCKRQPSGVSLALEDEAFAGHAEFDWRHSTVALPARGARQLRYRTYRQTARFSRTALPFALRPGDRVTRCWDGARFEIRDIRADGTSAVVCDVVEIERVH